LAGVAAVRAAASTSLKWPNDLLREDAKVGGILVEQRDAVTVIGLGLNLWWPEAPEGIAGLDSNDPGEERHAEVGALWGAELMELIESDVWPRDEYRRACSTLGKAVTWEPAGKGTATDVADDGGLVVETASGVETLHSGAIRHLRT
jgi:BirA family biotin operon repressor/biotin-[acetyl-CoA-carboxylase] ligase